MLVLLVDVVDVVDVVVVVDVVEVVLVVVVVDDDVVVVVVLVDLRDVCDTICGDVEILVFPTARSEVVSMIARNNVILVLYFNERLFRYSDTIIISETQCSRHR